MWLLHVNLVYQHEKKKKKHFLYQVDEGQLQIAVMERNSQTEIATIATEENNSP